MSSELIFVTGASGFVGSSTIDEALKAGYRVRAAVRRDAAAQQLKDYFGPKYGADKIETVIVTDITLAESFEGKLDGVSYIFHIASPLVAKSNHWRKDHIDPAVNGTIAILEAATKVPSIKRVVITSSIASLAPLEGTPDGVVLNEDSAKGIYIDPDTDFATGFQAYHASKVLADQATMQFLSERQPAFAIVTIHPSFIFGRNVLQRSAADLSGTNQMLWGSLLSPLPLMNPQGVHVLDVAEAHLRALSPAIPTGSKFLISAPQFDWNEAAAFVREKFPNVPVQLQAPPAKQSLIDTSRAEKQLGFAPFRSWQQFVGDVVEQQQEYL